MTVRFTCTSKRRVPENGMSGPSTWASSVTSPVLISLTASSTACGFMRLPEPRWSPAPHFDGQRALSGGTVQDAVCARQAVPTVNAALTAIPNIKRLMAFLPEIELVDCCALLDGFPDPRCGVTSASHPRLKHVFVRALRIHHVDALELDAMARLGLLQVMNIRAGEMAGRVVAELHHVEARAHHEVAGPRIFPFDGHVADDVI